MTKSLVGTLTTVGWLIMLSCSSGNKTPGEPNPSSVGGNTSVESPDGEGNAAGTGNSGTGLVIDSFAGTGNSPGDAGNSNPGAGSGSGLTPSVGGDGDPLGQGGSDNPATDSDDPIPGAGGEPVFGDSDDPPPADSEDPPPADSEDPPPADSEDPPPADTDDPPPADTDDPPPLDTDDPPPLDTDDPPPLDTDDPPPLEECVPSELEKVNVIVFKDAEPSGADSEGRMYVGGNLTAPNYTIATLDPTIATDCSDYGLVVGGTIDVGGGSVAGRVAYGVDAISTPTAECGVWNETPIDFATLEAQLTGYSIAFSQYPENGTSELNYGSLKLTGTDPELNVFYVTADEILSMSEIEIDAPEGSSVIVNISGEVINWSGGGFKLPDGASCRGGDSDWCHRIVYNMYEAESITLQGVGIQGSVLAPHATLEAASGGGNVDGQLIVEYLYGGIEYHPYFFEGCLLLPW